MRNIKSKNVKDILIQVEGEKEIFLTEEALELQKRGKGLIYFKDMDDDTKLFEMVINLFIVTLTSNSMLKTSLIAGNSR